VDAESHDGFFWNPFALISVEPGPLGFILTVAGGAWALWMATDPGDAFGGVLASLFLTLLGLAWGLRLLLAIGWLALRRRGAQIAWRRFLVQPLLVVVVALLLVTDAPLHARLAYARGSLEREGNSILAGTKDPVLVRHAGGYGFADVTRTHGVVIFETTLGAGLAYAPHGIAKPVPTGAYVGEFDHFTGPWYRWTTPDSD
jgi:hypothetical protein